MLSNVRHKAMITPVSPLPTSLFTLSRVTRQFIVRLKLSSKWELSTDWNLYPTSYANQLPQKTFNLILQWAARALTEEPE